MNNNIESAIAETGWGIYNYLFIVLCGFLSFAEASAALTVPMVVPLLACDFKLNKDQAVIPIATSYFGMAAGAFLFGSISDIAGRTKLIPITIGIAFCASVSLSFAQTNFLVNLSVFVLGVGVGGNNIILRIYLIECLPMRKRGTCLAVIDMFWMAGYLSILGNEMVPKTGVSWSLMPSVIRMLSKRFRPSSWRVLVFLCNAPSLVIACVSSLLPSSPRHSLYRRRPEQALTVLQQMYAINNSKHANTYPLNDLEGVYSDDESEEDDDDFLKNIQKYFTKTWERIDRMNRPPYKRTTLCGILACLLHFPGFVWFALWSTHMLQETERNITGGNDTCNVNIQNVALGLLRSCEEMNEARFELLSLISLGYVLGELLLIIRIDVIGRRLYLISSGLVGSVALLALIFRMHHIARMVLSLIFLAAYAIGHTTTYILLLENYPTALRGTMIGLMRILPHLAIFAIQLFLRTTCLVTIIVASILLLGAALVMLSVPDLTRLPMKE